MRALSGLLKGNGSVCLVVPTLVAFEWIREANSVELFCSKRMDVFSFAGDITPKRSLLCFSHELSKLKLQQMHIYKADKNYTDEYAAWLGI
jgi:tRNA1(Val) A37 N6-methylase TrmN6